LAASGAPSITSVWPLPVVARKLMAEPEVLVVVPAPAAGPVQLTVHSMNCHPQKSEIVVKSSGECLFFATKHCCSATCLRYTEIIA
jgi:hypothetical protein